MKQPQHPKWLVNNEKPQTGQLSEPGCGTVTNGIGALKKLEVNVKDIGSITPQLVVKEKCLKGSRKRER